MADLKYIRILIKDKCCNFKTSWQIILQDRVDDDQRCLNILCEINSLRFPVLISCVQVFSQGSTPPVRIFAPPCKFYLPTYLHDLPFPKNSIFGFFQKTSLLLPPPVPLAFRLWYMFDCVRFGSPNLIYFIQYLFSERLFYQFENG